MKMKFKKEWTLFFRYFYNYLAKRIYILYFSDYYERENK